MFDTYERQTFKNFIVLIPLFGFGNENATSVYEKYFESYGFFQTFRMVRRVAVIIFVFAMIIADKY